MVWDNCIGLAIQSNLVQKQVLEMNEWAEISILGKKETSIQFKWKTENNFERNSEKVPSR